MNFLLSFIFSIIVAPLTEFVNGFYAAVNIQNVIHSFHNFFHNRSTPIRQSKSVIFRRMEICCVFPGCSGKEDTITKMRPFRAIYKKAGSQGSCFSDLQGFSQNGFCGIGIEAHVRNVSCLPFIVGLGSDHGSIVAAET